MLTTILAFLVTSSALSIGGITLPQTNNSTSLISLGDGRPGIHDGPSNCRSVNWMDPNDFCMCFRGKGGDYGIDRGYMIDAIVQACDELTGGVGEPTAIYGRDIGLVGERTSTFTYPSTHDNEEGRIVTTLFIDDIDPNCLDRPWPISWDYCWDQLHHPVDTCDTAAENGKHGGGVVKGCVKWVIDPAPSTNEEWVAEFLDDTLGQCKSRSYSSDLLPSEVVR